MSGPGPLGCLALIGFFILELAAGLAAGALGYLLVSPLITAIVPARERDFAGVVSVCLAFIPAGIAMWQVDRICKRVTGRSTSDYIPDIPNF